MSDEPIADLTLAEVLAAAAEGLDAIAAGELDRTTLWTTAGLPFASLTGRRAEFRLDPMVARAALRTTDTKPSLRGPDWVAFSPAELDDSAVDRAEAWFLSAHRRAAASLA